jgi:HK97 family phage major capsid protein
MLARTDVAAPKAKGVAYDEATYTFERARHRSGTSATGSPPPLRARRPGTARGADLERLLEFGVDLALENEMLTGDGTEPHLQGILETDEINTRTRDTTNERRVEAIHRGDHRDPPLALRRADGIVLHPSDYEEIVFEKDDMGVYLLGPASQQTFRSLWGFPVVITSVMPEDTGIVGNWKMGATLYLRSGVTTRASDSHEDFFVRRMVALLAETRAAFAVRMPVAFCEVNAL